MALVGQGCPSARSAKTSTKHEIRNKLIVFNFWFWLRQVRISCFVLVLPTDLRLFSEVLDHLNSMSSGVLSPRFQPWGESDKAECK